MAIYTDEETDGNLTKGIDRDIHFTDNQGNEYFVMVRKAKVEVWRNREQIQDVRFYDEEGVIKNLLKKYNKKFIKVGTEVDFMFQSIYPLYRSINDCQYCVNIKSYNDFLYIKFTPTYENISQFIEFFNEEDREYFKSYFKL